MKRMIYALALLAALVGVGQAQEYKPDTVKLYVGLVNISDTGPDDIQGVNGQAQIKLFRAGIVQFDAAGDFAGYFPGEGSFYTFQAGPRVGVRLAKGKVVLYGGPQFGVITDFDGYTPYAYMIGGGADFNFSKHGFVRGGYNRQFVPNLDESFNRVDVGIGLRF